MTITDPLGHQTNVATVASGLSYNIFGEPLSVTDENNVVWDYGYDTRGRLLSSGISVAGGPETILTSYRYDSLGNTLSVIRSLGQIQSWKPLQRIGRCSNRNS